MPDWNDRDYRLEEFKERLRDDYFRRNGYYPRDREIQDMIAAFNLGMTYMRELGLA